MRLREQGDVFDKIMGAYPQQIEWLRLRPSGHLHAFDATYPPKRAVCGRDNKGGTTNRFPASTTWCDVCTDIVMYIEAVKADRAAP